MTDSLNPIYSNNKFVYNNPFLENLVKFNDYYLSYPSDCTDVIEKIIMLVPAIFINLGLAIAAVLTYPIWDWEKVEVVEEREREFPNPNQGGGQGGVEGGGGEGGGGLGGVLPGAGNLIKLDTIVYANECNKIINAVMNDIRHRIVNEGLDFNSFKFEFNTDSVQFVCEGELILDKLHVLENKMKAALAAHGLGLKKIPSESTFEWKFILIDGTVEHTFRVDNYPGKIFNPDRSPGYGRDDTAHPHIDLNGRFI